MHQTEGRCVNKAGEIIGCVAFFFLTISLSNNELIVKFKLIESLQRFNETGISLRSGFEYVYYAQKPRYSRPSKVVWFSPSLRVSNQISANDKYSNLSLEQQPTRSRMGSGPFQQDPTLNLNGVRSPLRPNLRSINHLPISASIPVSRLVSFIA